MNLNVIQGFAWNTNCLTSKLFSCKKYEPFCRALQKINKQKQGAQEGYSSSQPSHGRYRSFHGELALVRPSDYRNGTAEHKGHDNGGICGGLKNGLTHSRSNVLSAADNGCPVSPLS